MPFAIIAHRRVKVKNAETSHQTQPRSHLIEPANPSTPTSSTLDPKTPVLETLAEITCLLASGIVGWIAYVAF